MDLGLTYPEATPAEKLDDAPRPAPDELTRIRDLGCHDAPG